MSLNDPKYSKPPRTYTGPNKTQRIKTLREIKKNCLARLKEDPSDTLNRVLLDTTVTLLKLER